MYDVEISIRPVVGGFIVSYPKFGASGQLTHVTEVATSVGRTMRIAKDAVQEFSLVKKTEAETDE